MKRGLVFVLGLVGAGVVLVPLATAGAQAPPTTAGDEVATEGSIPPGGTVTCTTGATLTPDHGPPGTEVIVTTTFQGNCDDLAEFNFAAMECSGEYLVQGSEAVPFAMTVDPTNGNATGTFTAPVTEPDPPVQDATEPITVTVTCVVGVPTSPPTEGLQGGTTTYEYPPSNFTLELFADPDSDQPTLVEDDDEVIDDGGGVVAATPTFTG